MNALASYPGPYTPSTSTAANPSSRIAQRFFNVISPIDSRIFTPFSCSQLILNHTAHARMIITRSPQFRPSDISVVQNPASLPPKLNIDAYIDIATPNDAALGNILPTTIRKNVLSTQNTFQPLLCTFICKICTSFFS